MELKDFVGQALVEIVEGVTAAQSKLGESGVHVNPRLSTQQGTLESKGKLVSTYGRLVQLVEFDVAVTVNEATGTKGGIGIVGGIINLGTQGQSSESNSALSRIKFSVPMSLPEVQK